MAPDLARLRAVFLDELEERHRTLQDGLLELERDAATADRHLPELFRAAHSLKGGAHAVGLPAVATLCHRLEETLAGLRDGSTALTPELLSALLDDVDVLATHAAELSSAQEQDAPERTTRGGTPAPTEDTRDGSSAPRPSPMSTASTTGEVRPAQPSRPALRVPAQRMDVLLDRAGDVLLARDRLLQLVDDAERLADAAAVTDRRWREVGTHLDAELAPRPAAAVAAAERAWQRTRGRVEAVRVGAAATGRALQEAASGLEHDTRSLRLQPFRSAGDGLERAVRDLTSGSDREVRLVIDDGGVELDAEVVAALRDPLLHLARNAVAHGIEPVTVRREAGKADAGTVTVAARVLGEQVEIRVTDDGAGLDDAALRAGAATRGLETETREDATARLAWLPGLSTAAATDELAGRGVGLDAVRNGVEQLGGTVALRSDPGRGCTVTLHLPVTLATIHVLIVTAGDEMLALPSAAVRRSVRLPADAIEDIGGVPHVRVEDTLARVASLRTFLGLAPDPPREHHLGVYVTGAGDPAVLVVDGIVAARRVTRRPPHPRLVGAPGLIGTTMLPTGRVALVVNPLACVRDVASLLPPAYSQATVEPAPPPQVLLVEDAATTRALEQDILARAGYEVRVAVDGTEAWQLLREHGADLVVSDVEMPGMDGFELCRTIRAHPRLGATPVVLVTSRASDEDRHRGVEAGANAYLVKGAFDQGAFLATIGRLL